MQSGHSSSAVAQQVDFLWVDKGNSVQRLNGGERILDGFAEQRPLRIASVKILYLFQTPAVADLIEGEDGTAQARHREVRIFASMITGHVSIGIGVRVQPDDGRDLLSTLLGIRRKIEVAGKIVAKIQPLLLQAAWRGSAAKCGSAVKGFSAVVGGLTLSERRRGSQAPGQPGPNQFPLFQPLGQADRKSTRLNSSH